MTNLEKMYFAAKLLFEATGDWCEDCNTRCSKCPHTEVCTALSNFIGEYETMQSNIYRKRYEALFNKDKE